MFDNLTNLGIGVMVFALVIGVTSIVLDKFGNAVGGTPNTTTQYLLTQVGTSGLAGWTPAIIAFAVGMLFIGGILALKGNGGRR